MATYKRWCGFWTRAETSARARVRRFLASNPAVQSVAYSQVELCRVLHGTRSRSEQLLVVAIVGKSILGAPLCLLPLMPMEGYQTHAREEGPRGPPAPVASALKYSWNLVRT